MVTSTKMMNGVLDIVVILSILKFSNGSEQWQIFTSEDLKIYPNKNVLSDGIDLEICASTENCQTKYNSCGKTSYSSKHCHCDNLCKFYGDCCYDYTSTCNTTEFLPLSTHANELRCKKADFLFYYYVIGACKEDTPVDKDTINKCEYPGTGDILLSIIVSDNVNNIYKNVYCALCNGVPISEVSAWEVTYECSESQVREEFNLPPFQYNYYLYNEMEVETAKTTTEKPMTEAPLPPDLHTKLGQGDVFCSKVTKFKPPKNKTDNRRACNPKIIRTCKKNYLNETVISACLNGNVAVVYEYSSGNTYKNYHCAICNHNTKYTCNVADTSYVVDVDLPYFGLTPLTIIVDFSANSKITVNSNIKSYVIEGVTCSVGEVYDPFTNKCLTITCKNGFILQGSKCVAPLSISFVPAEFDSYSVTTIRTPVEMFCLCESEQQSLNIEYQYEINEQNFTIVTLLTKNLETLGVKYLEHYSDRSNMTLALIKIRSINCQLAYNISDIVIELIDNTLDSSLRVVAVKQNCSNGSLSSNLFCDYDAYILTPKFFEDTFDYTTRTLWHDNSSTYVPEEGYELKIIHQKNQFSTVRSSISVSTCEVCPQVLLSASAFTDDSNGSIVHVLSGKSFERNEYMFLNSSNNSYSVLVCSFLNQTQFLVVQTYVFHYTGALLITSVIGTVFSLIGLFITIVMRVIFSELRTMSGKIILNISIALFCALLLTLFQGYFVKWKTACEIIAATLHYLWLVCFMWMNIMSFELFRTFKFFRTSARSKNSQKKSFIFYSLYSWGIPAVFVAIIVFVSHQKEMDLSLMYGDDSVCWIVDGIASFYVFGIPLALILLPNLILFVVTITGIRSVKKSTTGITGKSKKQEVAEELVIYIRISTVMGLSWVFGFLASFTDHVVFWYLFIILNTLQGLFIFIAFNITHSMKNIITKSRRKYQPPLPLKTSKNTSSLTLHTEGKTKMTSLSNLN